MLRYLSCICFLGMLNLAIAQESDTLGCAQLRTEAKAFLEEQQYDSARLHYEAAMLRYQAFGARLAWIDTRNELADVFLFAGEYKRAREILQETLGIGPKYLGLQHPSLAFTRYLMGATCLYQGQYTQAIDWYRQALEERLALLDPQDPRVAKSYFGLGIAYDYHAKPDSALLFLKKAMAIQEQGIASPDRTLATTYNSIGIVYRALGDFDSTLHYYQQAIHIRSQLDGPDHVALALNYHNLGVLYLEKGDYHRGIPLVKRGLAIREQAYGPDHPILFSSLYEMGAVYQKKGDYDQAQVYYQRCINLTKEKMGEDHYYLTHIYSSLGNLNHEIGLAGKAIEFHQQARRIYEKVLGPENDQVSLAINNIGVVLEGQGKFEEALIQYQKSLAIRLKTRGPSHESLAFGYQHMGNCYRALKNLPEAMFFHQKAAQRIRETMGKQQTPLADVYRELAMDHQVLWREASPNNRASLQDSVNGYFSQAWQILSLTDEQAPGLAQDISWDNIQDARTLIRLLEKWADFEQECGNSDLALGYLNHAIEGINFLNQSYHSQGSRLSLFENKLSVYEKALSLAWDSYEKTGKRHYLEEAFLLSEQSKANLLLAALAESEAREFAGIPGEILEQERNLRIDLSYYETRLKALKADNDGVESEEVDQLEDRIFNLRTAYIELLRQLEKDYPRYHQLKYQVQRPGVAELQANLAPGTLLLEYFCGDSAWYVFWLRHDKLGAHKVNQSGSLVEDLRKLLALLQDEKSAEERGNDPELIQEFYQYAQQVSQKLLPSAAEWETLQASHLLIIPDGGLSYVPFEVLMEPGSEVSGPMNSFAQLPYIFLNSPIHYAYYAMGKKDMDKPGSSSKGSFVGFAPQYKGENPLLPPLAGNQEEVSLLQKLMGGKGFLGEEATEAVFHQEAGNHQILHLAMHTLLDDREPMSSGLVFGGDSSQEGYDGVLHTYELYNLALRSELAVLSACHTGQGQLARGEGMMSLARAFRYAGCPALISSLWQADDYSSAQLMQAFYQELKKGLPKDEALQLSKKHFLQEGRRSHPYYWATFIQVGNSQPLSGTFPWILLLGGIAVLLLALGILWRFHQS